MTYATRFRAAAVAAVVAAVVVSPRPGVAQGSEVTWGAANVAVGAVSAGIRAVIAGEPVWPAVVGGGAGGAVMAAGFVMVGSGNDAMRFAGLQTVALGANVARNVGDGLPWDERLVFPVLPAYVEVRRDPDGGRSVQVRLSVTNVVGVVMAASADGAAWDVRESVLTGAPVFRVDGDRVSRGVRAMHRLGAVVYAGDHPDLLAEEAVHVGQYHRDSVLHAYTASETILRAHGAERVMGWLSVDVFRPLFAVDVASGLAMGGGYGSWLEVEGDAFVGVRFCDEHAAACPR